MRVHSIILTPSLIRRFWKYVDQTSSPSGCWLWTATKHPKSGHGKISAGGMHGVMLMASRVSWTIHVGTVPDDLFVLHNCPGGDNPACVNPDHLWLGDAGDNVQDMWDKQRHPISSNFGKGEQNWANRHPELLRRGAANNKTKLTEDDVRAIRRAYATGLVTIKGLSKQYSVSLDTIWNIIHHHTWVYVL